MCSLHRSVRDVGFAFDAIWTLKELYSRPNNRKPTPYYTVRSFLIIHPIRLVWNIRLSRSSTSLQDSASLLQHCTSDCWIRSRWKSASPLHCNLSHPTVWTAHPQTINTQDKLSMEQVWKHCWEKWFEWLRLWEDVRRFCLTASLPRNRDNDSLETIFWRYS